MHLINTKITNLFKNVINRQKTFLLKHRGVEVKKERKKNVILHSCHPPLLKLKLRSCKFN